MDERPEKLSDRLALERTARANERTSFANERTLMAWVRTALSMISFGFTIYKFLQSAVTAGGLVRHPNSPRNLGLTLVGVGTITLILATINYLKIDKRLVPGKKLKERLLNVTFVAATVVALIGLLVTTSIVFDMGPF